MRVSVSVRVYVCGLYAGKVGSTRKLSRHDFICIWESLHILSPTVRLAWIGFVSSSWPFVSRGFSAYCDQVCVCVWVHVYIYVYIVWCVCLCGGCEWLSMHDSVNMSVGLRLSLNVICACTVCMYICISEHEGEETHRIIRLIYILSSRHSVLPPSLYIYLKISWLCCYMTR